MTATALLSRLSRRTLRGTMGFTTVNGHDERDIR